MSHDGIVILNNIRIFKIDSEFNGRGTASFTLEGVKQFTEIKLCTEIREAEVNAIKNLITAVIY